MGYSDSPSLFVLYTQKIFSREVFKECWDKLSEEDRVILGSVFSFKYIVISYIDDLWMFSDPNKGLKGHLPVIKLTFMTLERAGVLLGPKKCTFYTQYFKA